MAPLTALAILTLSVLPLSANAQTYSLLNQYQGSNFFNQWNFSTDIDVNYGNVAFQSYENAIAQKLVYINDAGNAIIKIDNTTVGNPADEAFGRNSVYMMSNASVNIGSLILFDALHAPFGCSVWPAFFTVGAGVVWPDGGEIDIFEAVNQATLNQYSLHTLEGCTRPNTSDVISAQKGSIISTDCYNVTNGNQGCITAEPQANSFGSGFNGAGGGAYATLFNRDGIKLWFFPRASVPSDFASSSPNPANWGTPSAYFPSSSCNITQFFTAQQLILDINICGSYGIGAFSATCQGNCFDLVRNPTNYDNAYFEIQFIKVFAESESGGGGVTPPIPSGTASRVTSPSSPATTGAALTTHTMLISGSGVMALSTLFAIMLTAAFSMF